ncbi:MAG: hypothetical protein BMS9Abin33_1321 [Gammaproteobacteria bacterium]|nr:MAG: hypothetical protein BMS9Abin33_1321 [Gammaproteobacteria bacterium]
MRNKKLSKISLMIVIISTLLYWFWESQAEGNIRIDLLVIYPVLFLIYIVSFWSKFRYLSIPIGFLIMLVNIGFFIISYPLFNKNLG